MGAHKGASAIVNEMAAQMGLEFGKTTAERARIIAEEILESGDDDLILELMADGVAKHLSRIISRRRREVGVKTSRDGWQVVENKAPSQSSYLDLPIVIPGQEQIYLRHATATKLRQAQDALLLQRRGLDYSERQLRLLIDALIGLPPNESIESLVARGVLDLNRVFAQREKSA